MPEIKISMEDPERGTVSAWIDQETRNINLTLGKPNPGYIIDWKNELRRLQAEYPEVVDELELNGPEYESIPPLKRAKAARAKYKRKNGLTYDEIADDLEVHRSTVYRWHYFNSCPDQEICQRLQPY